MIRPRAGYTAASSKATAQTLCQKCLQRDTYECQAGAQERPYVPRPSRTQQLANPKLAPRLASDNLLRKDGIADQELARKEAERRSRDDPAAARNAFDHSTRRSRSVSSYSSSSVESVSTIASRSSSPEHHVTRQTGQSQGMSNLEVHRKRRRRSSSASSSSRSPNRPPQRHDFSDDHASRPMNGKNERSRRKRPTSRDRSSWRSPEQARQRSSFQDQDLRKRRRRGSRSPSDRGRHRDEHRTRGSRRTRSPEDSRSRSRVIRNRKSMTPGVEAPKNPGDASRRGYERPSFSQHNNHSKDHERYGRPARSLNGGNRAKSPPAHLRGASRERSLSPFSKRLALTQAMNSGQ